MKKDSSKPICKNGCDGSAGAKESRGTSHLQGALVTPGGVNRRALVYANLQNEGEVARGNISRTITIVRQDCFLVPLMRRGKSATRLVGRLSDETMQGVNGRGTSARRHTGDPECWTGHLARRTENRRRDPRIASLDSASHEA